MGSLSQWSRPASGAYDGHQSYSAPATGSAIFLFRRFRDYGVKPIIGFDWSNLVRAKVCLSKKEFVLQTCALSTAIQYQHIKVGLNQRMTNNHRIRHQPFDDNDPRVLGHGPPHIGKNSKHPFIVPSV